MYSRFFREYGRLIDDVLDAEANIYMVFSGFNAMTTENMDLEELALWNDKAIERHKLQNQSD